MYLTTPLPHAFYTLLGTFTLKSKRNPQNGRVKSRFVLEQVCFSLFSSTPLKKIKDQRLKGRYVWKRWLCVRQSHWKYLPKVLTFSPLIGGKNWALLLDIRCPVLSFWFYFCAYFCVRRYTVYIGIFPTFTIWKIWTPQQKEFSLCFLSLHLHPPPPNNMLLWTYISSPYGFPCQCIYVCFPTVGEVAAFGSGLIMPASGPGCIS